MMLFIVLLLLVCFQGFSAVRWASSAYQNTTTVCSGRILQIGWDYNLEYGETVNDIVWFFTPASGQLPSIIATTLSVDFTYVPSYDRPINRLSNGIIVLSSVTSADAGTYTTEIITKQTTGSTSTIRRNQVVTVTDSSAYRDNVLSVKMDDVANYDRNLRVKLTCGPIAWRGESPVDVTWTTPSGAKLNSTGYENDYFYLMLDRPVVSGIYACGLSASAITALCLHTRDPASRQATFRVGDYSDLLSTLEADNLHLTRQLQNITQTIQQLERGNPVLAQQLQDAERDNLNLTQQLRDVDLKLTQRLEQVERDNINLTQQKQDAEGDLTQLQQVQTEQDQFRAEVGNNIRRMVLLKDDLHQYRNFSSTHVGFHAGRVHSVTLGQGDSVKFPHVYYNAGGAYDKSTGLFTAPVDGTYFFAFTTSGFPSGSYGDSDLRADGVAVAHLRTLYTHYLNPATGHAVLRLVKGRTVSVRTVRPGQSFHYHSLFSGFLIRPDWNRGGR